MTPLIRTAILVLATLLPVSAIAATFSLTASGTVTPTDARSAISPGSAVSLALEFDVTDGIINSLDVPSVTDVSGSLAVAGFGSFALTSGSRTGVGVGEGYSFDGPDFGNPGIFKLRVRFDDGMSPFGRSRFDFLDGLDSGDIDLTITEVFTDFGSRGFSVDVDTLSFGRAVAPVPLPASALLLLAGIAGLVGFRRQPT